MKGGGGVEARFKNVTVGTIPRWPVCRALGPGNRLSPHDGACVCGLPLCMWWWFYFVLGGGGLAEKSVPRSTVAPEAGHSHLPLMGNRSPSQNWAGGCMFARGRHGGPPAPTRTACLQTLLPSCCPPGKLLGMDFQQWCPRVASSVQ